MIRQQLTARNPLRILEKTISGGLQPGGLGLVIAPAGVGKTAFLVQIGLDAVMREKNVLHIALGQSTNHLQAWYDALFNDMAGSRHDEEIEELRNSSAHYRVLQTYADTAFSPQRLEQTVGLFQTHIKFKPDVMLIDGFDWQSASTVGIAAAIGAFRSCAQRLGSQLWMSAQPHTALAKTHPTSITPPCDAFEELIDVAIYLEPAGANVCVRILKDNGHTNIPDPQLLIHCDTLSLAAVDAERPLNLPPGAHTLLSGGAQGAEALFGQCAEQWNLEEINFSFDGHEPVRTKGLVKLSSSDLAQGEVSDAYLSAQMHRSYPSTPLFRKVLQSIWHQVSTAGEVFVVGSIMPDTTVRGGTGWSAELAKHWRKPVHVFDQEKTLWFIWRDGAWAEEAPPVISRTRFTGTGTRFLNEQGRAAIMSLFDRSFGAK